MYIGFSYKKNNLFSSIIAKTTKSNYSHCFIILKPIGTDYLIIESSFVGGVKFNLLSSYKDTNKYDLAIYRLPIEDDNVDILLPYIGKNYGYTQILGFLLAKLLKLKENPFTKNIICSEIVLLALLNSNLSVLFEQLDLNYTSPQDIFVIADNNFEKVNI